MGSIIGVRFERAGRVRYLDSADLTLQVGDFVVAEEAGEEKVGRVVIAPEQLLFSQLRKPVPPISRKASAEDLKRRDAEGTRP